MQEKYIKNILTKINSRELVKDQFKKVQTIKLEKISRHKLGNKIIQKREFITIEEAWEKIIDKKANEVVII